MVEFKDLSGVEDELKELGAKVSEVHSLIETKRNNTKFGMKAELARLWKLQCSVADAKDYITKAVDGLAEYHEHQIYVD